MAIASKTTAAKAVEVQAVEVQAAEALDAPALVRVRNNSERVLNLESGQLLVGQEGDATIAEASMLSAYLVRL